MSAPRWWSEKSKQHVEIGEMNEFHAKAALAKLNRGDAFGPDGEPLAPADALELRGALMRRIGITTEMEADNE